MVGCNPPPLSIGTRSKNKSKNVFLESPSFSKKSILRKFQLGDFFALDQNYYYKLYNPILDTRSSGLCLSIMLRPPSLDSETGWTGELWPKTKIAFCLAKKIFKKNLDFLKKAIFEIFGFYDNF